jgi:alpha-beta hydrolase superfamily lysophospholipase/ubiquinone/menaquinone biosynthesis C-methylase UbiE
MSPLPVKNIVNLEQNLLFARGKPVVQLELNGATWQGSISSLTEKELLVSVEGFVPITISPGVNFTLSTGQTSLEIRGKVSSVTVEKKGEVTGVPHFGHMVVQISWAELDEFTSFKLKAFLGRKEWTRGIEHIVLTFIADQTGDRLFDLSPSPTTLFKNHANLPELAKASQQKLISTPFHCPNDSGKNIVGYVDHQEHVQAQAPVVVLAPGYGETKREYITLAYYLASNGFNVLRYDHTDHVGESDGDHEQTSLTNMKQDMATMLDFAKQNWGQSKVALVATSLAGRVALKVLSEDRQVDQLILISGIVDVRATLASVHQEDLIGDYLDGHGRSAVNALGFNVNSHIFLKDAVEGKFSDLATTIQDAQGMTSPLIWFSAEQDAWVEKESLQQIFEAFQPQQCRTCLIPEGLHRLQENPRKARAVYRDIVFACQEQLAWHLSTDELIEPSRKEIGQQNRIERENNQTRRFQHEADHVDFWSHYLSNFHYIAFTHDYMAALDHIYHLLGTVSPGDRLLDVGCGNGHFGSFLFVKEWMQRQQTESYHDEPIHYVGVDFVETALKEANSHLNQLLKQASQGPSACTKPSNILMQNFYRLDLNKPLPFKDGSFNRIMSNLVIGYLRDPAASIRELLRVLAPGGKLVLSNLKPSSDLTQIYRNFVGQSQTETAIQEARDLLNNSSHIRQGESEGAFQFYTQEEFHQVLLSCGVNNPRVFPTFGNQAFIGVVEKPALREKEAHAVPRTLESLVAA